MFLGVCFLCLVFLGLVAGWLLLALSGGALMVFFCLFGFCWLVEEYGPFYELSG